jgi:hypothetical protein
MGIVGKGDKIALFARTELNTVQGKGAVDAM